MVPNEASDVRHSNHKCWELKVFTSPVMQHGNRKSGGEPLCQPTSHQGHQRHREREGYPITMWPVCEVVAAVSPWLSQVLAMVIAKNRTMHRAHKIPQMAGQSLRRHSSRVNDWYQSGIIIPKPCGFVQSLAMAMSTNLPFFTGNNSDKWWDGGVW